MSNKNGAANAESFEDFDVVVCPCLHVIAFRRRVGIEIERMVFDVDRHIVRQHSYGLVEPRRAHDAPGADELFLIKVYCFEVLAHRGKLGKLIKQGGSGVSAEARALIERFLAIDGDPDAAAGALRSLAEDAKIDLGPALDRFEHRIGFIAARGVAIDELRFSARFIRTLDYYTGFVFETRDAARPNDPPLVGGGRYDRLMTALGATSEIPAVGAALWADRRAAGEGA